MYLILAEYTFLIFFATFKSINALENEAILGRNLAPKKRFQFYLSLRYHGVHLCGTSILSDYYVLTAAHCVMNYEIEHLLITTSRLSKSISSEDITRSVADWRVPGSYVEGIGDDIAVLTLNDSFNLENNPQLSFVYLPSKIDKTEYVSRTAVTPGLGWDHVYKYIDPITGKRKYYGDLSPTLKWANLYIIGNPKCQFRYTNKIHAGIICGLVEERPSKIEGHCLGDSGSPLALEEPDHTLLIGVLSLVPIDCRDTRRATQFIRIALYLPFIKEHTKGNVSIK